MSGVSSATSSRQAPLQKGAAPAAPSAPLAAMTSHAASASGGGLPAASTAVVAVALIV